MEKGTTYVALDDCKRKIVAGILRAPSPSCGICRTIHTTFGACSNG